MNYNPISPSIITLKTKQNELGKTTNNLAYAFLYDLDVFYLSDK